MSNEQETSKNYFTEHEDQKKSNVDVNMNQRALGLPVQEPACRVTHRPREPRSDRYEKCFIHIINGVPRIYNFR